MTGAPKNLGVDTFLDPVGHFGAAKWPFWILQVINLRRKFAQSKPILFKGGTALYDQWWKIKNNSAFLKKFYNSKISLLSYVGGGASSFIVNFPLLIFSDKNMLSHFSGLFYYWLERDK